MTFMTYDMDDLGNDYPILLRAVEESGDVVRPRGQEVREVRPLVLQLKHPEYSLTFRKGINRALMYLEIASILAGSFNEPLFKLMSPNAASLLTPGGAYGPRTQSQMLTVLHELIKDPDSRRAIVMVSRPDDLFHSYNESTTDQPCTLTWQFMIRHGKLDMIVNMRSWDLVWGLANDVPCFTSVQRCLADALGRGCGDYFHVAGSGHIYSRHYGLWRDAKQEPGRPLQSLSADISKHNPLERWTATVQNAAWAISCAQFGNWDLIKGPWEEPAKLWRKKLEDGSSQDQS